MPEKWGLYLVESKCFSDGRMNDSSSMVEASLALDVTSGEVVLKMKSVYSPCYGSWYLKRRMFYECPNKRKI